MMEFIERVARGEIGAPPVGWLEEQMEDRDDRPVIGLLTVFRTCEGCGGDTLTKWPALGPIRCTDCDGREARA